MRLTEPRPLLQQAVLVLVVVLLVALVAANVQANIARLNIEVGFGFLQRTAGFDIAQALVPYPHSATYLRAILVAFVNTALIAAISIVAGTVLGLFVALARLSTNPLLSLLALAYIEAVRNIPLLLQLFFWYFSVLGSLPLPRQSLELFGAVYLNKRGLSLPAPIAEPGFFPFLIVAVVALMAAWLLFRRARRLRIASGNPQPTLFAAAAGCLLVVLLYPLVFGQPVSWRLPELHGFNIAGGVAIIPEFVAMAVGMSVYGSAFIAELIRGGILTVGKGQTEAGLALGLSRGTIYAKIIIPQVFRAVIPPLTGQYITLLKNSSLAAAIGYPDLMLIVAGTTLNQTGQPLEVMAIAMGCYLLLNLLISLAGTALDRHLRIVER
jgi:general L-amino acid transport system permease protein